MTQSIPVPVLNVESAAPPRKGKRVVAGAVVLGSMLVVILVAQRSTRGPRVAMLAKVN